MDNTFLKGQTAEEFDYYRIREEIASLAQTEEGRDRILQREATFDREAVNALKELGRQWHTYLNSTRPNAIQAFPPVREYFPVLAVEGSALMQDQIFALGLFATYAERCRDMIESAAMEMEIPALREKADSIPPLTNARNEIFSIMDTTGEVKDLPRLREIRSRILSLRKEIESAIRKYTADSSMSSALQSNVPAFRADRELLAVRADRRNSIKGIVHEVSSSGQTLYIEPEEIVRANNELVEEEFRLQSEMNKIFRELTETLSIYREDFIKAHDTIMILDETLAGAKWQKKVNGIFAEDCDLSVEAPAIFGARHPLLGDKAVPVNISFMHGKNVLIITGPNTGGKTVTLKTLALFSLLNQAGFPIPAEEGTRLPFFSSIFADIGDEQSIDQSLSTFSSRMKKIARALDNCSETSLVLLDELGSGTDPQEGSAVAMAVLDTLLEKNSFVIATTHHGVLKNYGWTNPKCINASVEFNSETMRPTYRLLMGVPGESHAIEIASYSGLNPQVIERARKYIATEQADVSALIRGLSAKHSELDELLKAQNERQQMLEEKELKIHRRENRAAEKEIELKKIEHTQSTKFLRETRSKLENLVRVLREGEITREKIMNMRSFISEFEGDVARQEESISELEKKLDEETKLAEKEEERISANGIRIKSSGEGNRKSSGKKTKQRMKNSEALKNAEPLKFEAKDESGKKTVINPEDLFVEGAEVLAGSDRRKGILVREEKKGTWIVQFGSMKMSVPKRQLVPLSPQEILAQKNTPQKSAIIIGSDGKASGESPKFELRLLGMRYEEAMKALERQLDLCAIHNFRNFSIVHGKGTGVLQQAVQDYLSHYPGVKDFHFARPEEGGTGKTYVELH